MTYAQFKKLCTECLTQWGLYSPAVVELDVHDCGARVNARVGIVGQVNGPALSLFQIEPPTHDDIWQNGPGMKARAWALWYRAECGIT